MFLRAKVIEIRNHFNISMISSIIIATSSAGRFKYWMDKNYMFITVGDFGNLVRPIDGMEQYIKLLYLKSNQPNIDKIIKKWGIYDPNEKSSFEKVQNWLTFHLGTFIKP